MTDVFVEVHTDTWLLAQVQRFEKWLSKSAMRWLLGNLYRTAFQHVDTEHATIRKVHTMTGSKLPLAVKDDMILAINPFLPLDRSLAWWPVQPPLWPIVWKAGLGALGYWLVLTGFVWWRRKRKQKNVVV